MDRQNDGFSIASLILGIIGLLCACCGCGFIFNILAIIFGWISGRNSDGQKSKLAFAGIILGIVGLVLSIGIFVYALISGAYTEYMNSL